MNLRLRTWKMSGFKYWVRVQRGYILQVIVLWLSKFIVHNFIYSKKVLELKFSEEGMDPYSYCNSSMRQFCPIRRSVKYMLYAKGDGYMFYGEDELECYTKCITRMLGKNPRIYPPRRLKKVVND